MAKVRARTNSSDSNQDQGNTESRNPHTAHTHTKQQTNYSTMPKLMQSVVAALLAGGMNVNAKYDTPDHVSSRLQVQVRSRWNGNRACLCMMDAGMEIVICCLTVALN